MILYQPQVKDKNKCYIFNLKIISHIMKESAETNYWTGQNISFDFVGFNNICFIIDITDFSKIIRF